MSFSYSLIQLCPDWSRLEKVNVGLLVFGGERPLVRTQAALGQLGVVRGDYDKQDLQFACESIESLIKVARSVDEIQDLANRPIGDLQLTSPRPIAPMSDDEFEELFQRLVLRNEAGQIREMRSSVTKTLPASPAVMKQFKKLNQEKRAEVDVEVAVPLRPSFVANAQITNGMPNLFRSTRLSSKSRSDTKEMLGMQIDGHLLGTNKAGESKLIVIPSEDSELPNARVIDELTALFERCEARFIYEEREILNYIDILVSHGQVKIDTPV